MIFSNERRATKMRNHAADESGLAYFSRYVYLKTLITFHLFLLACCGVKILDLSNHVPSLICQNNSKRLHHLRRWSNRLPYYGQYTWMKDLLFSAWATIRKITTLKSYSIVASTSFCNRSSFNILLLKKRNCSKIHSKWE